MNEEYWQLATDDNRQTTNQMTSHLWMKTNYYCQMTNDMKKKKNKTAMMKSYD